MKTIEIDEELYQYIASNTQFIGESASSILRRLLAFPELQDAQRQENPARTVETVEQAETEVVEEPVSQEVIGSVFDHINKEELAIQRGAVGRFLLILQALYRVHQKRFDVVCTIRGRDRLYFANNEEALAESGSSTKPRQIPDSPYWVITNSNTTRKKMMLTEVSKALGYSDQQAEKIRELL
ncbi:replication initiation negative regulator SeqA [Thalassotalea euphylliae]|uniref:replication initiation negative regulator SeqA n=1 Tax=Thalassotalea euphylliae TaxID=1655234 RepID=UPI00362EB556